MSETNQTLLDEWKAYEKALKAYVKQVKDYVMGLVAGTITADSSNPPSPPIPPTH